MIHPETASALRAGHDLNRYCACNVCTAWFDATPEERDSCRTQFTKGNGGNEMSYQDAVAPVPTETHEARWLRQAADRQRAAAPAMAESLRKIRDLAAYSDVEAEDRGDYTYSEVVRQLAADGLREAGE